VNFACKYMYIYICTYVDKYKLKNDVYAYISLTPHGSNVNFVHIYIYIYIYVYTHVCIYIHKYKYKYEIYTYLYV